MCLISAGPTAPVSRTGPCAVAIWTASSVAAATPSTNVCCLAERNAASFALCTGVLSCICGIVHWRTDSQFGLGRGVFHPPVCGYLLIGISVLTPHEVTMLVVSLVLDSRMSHWPVDGRYTARSILPSPS